MTASDVPALPADLEAGLRRLKLRTMRALAPEVLQTAKVQRWAPDELLRTLVDAEITARDQAPTRWRHPRSGLLPSGLARCAREPLRVDRGSR